MEEPIAAPSAPESQLVWPVNKQTVSLIKAMARGEAPRNLAPRCNLSVAYVYQVRSKYRVLIAEYKQELEQRRLARVQVRAGGAEQQQDTEQDQ